MERKMARDLDRYITGNYGEKQMQLPAHTCVDRPELPCDACGTTAKHGDGHAEMFAALEAIVEFWLDEGRSLSPSALIGPFADNIGNVAASALQKARGQK